MACGKPADLGGTLTEIHHASPRREERVKSVRRQHAPQAGREDDSTLDLSSLVEWDLKPCIAHVRVVRWTRAGREHKRFTLRRLEGPGRTS
jgi:hypothetical protein